MREIVCHQFPLPLLGRVFVDLPLNGPPPVLANANHQLFTYRFTSRPASV